MTAALGKDLIGLERLSPDQIRLILDTAEPFKEVSERPIKNELAAATYRSGYRHCSEFGGGPSCGT